MSKLKILRKTEIYFLIGLFLLNFYLAIVQRGENVVDISHMMMAAIMLMLANDKILNEVEKK